MVMRGLAYSGELRLNQLDKRLFLVVICNCESPLQDIIYEKSKSTRSHDNVQGHLLANWSFIIDTTGLDPSGRAVMISSTSARRV